MKELLDDERIKIAILAFIAGVILAFIVYPRPEQETVYKFETKVETDTVYKEIKDTVYIPKTKIKTEVLRDTILVDYKPIIKSFSATTPFEYGKTYVSGEVLGEVLKMTVTNDFKIPTVTNTITNTETKTIVQKPKGIYIGAGISFSFVFIIRIIFVPLLCRSDTLFNCFSSSYLSEIDGIPFTLVFGRMVYNYVSFGSFTTVFGSFVNYMLFSTSFHLHLTTIL